MYIYIYIYTYIYMYMYTFIYILCAAVCCSDLRCVAVVAVCYHMLHLVATLYPMQYTAEYVCCSASWLYSVLQCIMTVCVAVCRNCVCCSASLMCVLQCVVTVCVAVRRDVAPHAVCCSALQPLAVCCSMLQRAINQASNLCFIRFFFLATLKRLF